MEWWTGGWNRRGADSYHEPSPGKDKARCDPLSAIESFPDSRLIPTEWEALPEERRRLREYEKELKTTIRRPLVEVKFHIDPNTAARDELMRLPGIGEAMAVRIIESRPHADAEALLKVSGIGEKTLERMRPFLQFADHEVDP